MEWQRKWPRFDQSGMVSLVVVQSKTRMQASVEDVSVGGMCLAIRMPLAHGDAVVIRSARGTRNAVVRRCEERKSDASFLIGVEFQPGAA